MRENQFNIGSLKSMGGRLGRTPILGLVFLLCLGAGLFSGKLFNANNNPADAASANITVTNNYQVSIVDQSTGDQVLARTSTVTVKSPTASGGYRLFAKIAQNSLPGAIVTIESSSSSTCSSSNPCNLSADAAKPIITTDNGNATTSDGDTTTWQVKITIPAGTAKGHYTVDIEYSEESYFAMQEYTAAQCEAAEAGATLTMRDMRDGTFYRVKKMIDGNCWMVDNLALDLTQTYTGKPAWNTAPVTVSDTDASVNSVPQQAVNNNIEGQGQIPNNGSAKASYFYNWCAALADTSTTCTASRSINTNNTVISGKLITTGTTTSQPEVTGICPSPFRLPKGGPEATSSNAISTANEFGKLDIAMGGTGANRIGANTYSLWMGTAAVDTNWLGTLSGYYLSGFIYKGITEAWWSSTAGSSNFAYYLVLGAVTSSSNTSSVYTARSNGRRDGFSVRCLVNPSDPDLTQITTMQEMNEHVCDITAAGAMKSLQDTRNNTYYRVKKMADGNCWMVDNLALDLTQSYTGKPSWGTAPVTVSGSTGSVNNVPQQILNNNTANQGQIPNNGSAKASYLYNWCAALADTSSACAASVAAAANNTVISGATVTTGTTTNQAEVTGICPAPFRLPKGGPQATSSDKATTANEFAKLDIEMGGTGANRTSANTYSTWMGTAAAETNWLGVFSGYYLSGFSNQGSRGRWWSSTAYDATYAYDLGLNSSNTYVYPASIDGYKYVGRAVRCVL